ncbi:MAG TPA: right-handed parallel beta-helix repeat-containing protein [Candidatus Acidoferrum sp.]|nr:right-handed parallel beta-helix repeat-containing protein [Candidatus Acidoferrum sp.]
MSKAICRLLATIMSVWLCAIPGWSTVQESNKLNRIGERQLPPVRRNIPQPNAIQFNCNNAQHLTLSNFLAGLDPDKPSTILVSGTCTDNLHITGINRLTLLGAPGATINDASGGNDFVVTVVNTLTLDFEGFTINGGAGGFFCGIYSTCLLAGNTIQNSLDAGVFVNRSHAILQGDTIQNNGGRGVTAVNAANVTLAEETVRNNSFAGVAAFYGTNLNVQFSVITSNGGAGGIRVGDHSTLRLIDSTIQGNPNGVSLESSSEGTFENFGAGSTITGNAGAGVLVQDQAFGNFSNGPNTITGNLGGLDVACFGQFPVTLSAKTLIGPGTTNCPN